MTKAPVHRAPRVRLAGTPLGPALLALVLILGGTGSGTAQEATGRFELRSEPRISLHHFLRAWARADRGFWPEWAVPVEERAYWRVELSEDEARTWAAAVDAYHATRRRSLLFDEGLLAVRDRLTGAPDGGPVPEGDRALLEAVEAALPVYLRHWWPEHDLRNRAWIQAVAPALAAVEEDMIGRLGAAYGGRWPEARIPVDVVPYPNPVGAYSTRGRVTVSSLDPDVRMPQALEMLLHEASHVGPLEDALRGGIRDAYEATGAPAPERLWHDMIFYTTGEITRMVLESRGHPDYIHYQDATGSYGEEERWRRQMPAFDAHWGPFLRSGPGAGEGARRAALEGLARALMEGDGGGGKVRPGHELERRF